MSAPQPLLLPEQEQALHRRLCEGDPLAPDELCRRYLNPLVGWLRENHREMEDAVLVTAAHEAVIGLIKSPSCYDPARLDLFGYLRMAARGDLRNLLRDERRHYHGREPWNAVEKAEEVGNYPESEEDPAVHLERAEVRQAAAKLICTASADWTQGERQVLELILRGEKRTEMFAGVIGAEGLTFAEQQEAVNCVKDRIMKRLKREVKRRE